MYELCRMLMLSSSSPYVHGLSILYIFLADHLAAKCFHTCHFALLGTCMAKAVFSTGVVLTCTTLCSHTCMFRATVLQSFSLCVYSSSCRPIGNSASRSDRNRRKCYHHCRYFWYHLGVGVHMDRQRLVYKMQLVQLLYIY